MEKHCSQRGLPEREDNIIVAIARAISQVKVIKEATQGGPKKWGQDS